LVSLFQFRPVWKHIESFARVLKVEVENKGMKGGKTSEKSHIILLSGKGFWGVFLTI
jgi:hypothetical protein